LKNLPAEVQRTVGRGLLDAQFGGTPLNAKPMKHLGSGVFEIVEDFDTDTYRGVYTVRFEGAIYVLHAFKKKSKHGAETPRHTIALIKQRLKEAERHYRQWKGN
jgi:phage-related protein